jgi:hypothetical protein
MKRLGLGLGLKELRTVTIDGPGKAAATPAQKREGR